MKISKEQIEKSLSILTYIRKDFEKFEDIFDTYYHLLKDLLLYPLAWCYVIWSKRGAGKTYSGLWLCYYCNIKCIYIKRTDDDVDLILREDDNIDASPYKSLKRDKNIHVTAQSIDKGFGAYYEADEEGKPKRLLCYVISFNRMKSYKGFDFSDCDFIIFDEFIPQLGERIRRVEGEQMLDLYMTVSRDRVKRGKLPLKLILFANAEQISTPVTNELEIVDDMADLTASNNSHMYIEDREIMLHHITNEEVPISEEEKIGIYKGMMGTAWFNKSFNGEFTHNDFSNVTKRTIKRSIPLIQIYYRTHDYYVYFNEEKGMYYMCSIPAKCRFYYNLNRENEQKKFYTDFCIDLCESCVEERFKFERYSMYDLIINFKKFFNITY